MNATLFNWNKKQTQLFIGIALGITAIIYYLLHTRYMLYKGDEAWRMSRAYGYLTTGFNRDTIYTTVETEDKTLIFTILYNTLLGYYLEFFGWTKSNAHLFSTALIAICSILWFYILRALSFSFNVSLIFSLTFLLFPVYFGAANLIRLDPFTLLWSSTAFYLFIREKYFFTGLCIMIGMETHPMGMMGGFYIIAYVLSRWRYFFSDLKRLVKIIFLSLAGIGIGVLYYLFLHWDILTWERFSEILLNNRNIKKELPNYIITYFIQPEWYLHVWELFLLIGSLLVYFIKKFYKKNTFVWVFLAVLFFSTFVTGRPNRNYFLLIFPAFHLLMLFTAEQLDKLKGFTFLLYAIFILNYGGFYWVNKSYDFAKITNRIEQNLKDPMIPVVGMSENWFAAKDRPFYLIYNSIHDLPEQNLPELYLIQTDYLHTAPVSIKLENYILEKGWTKDPLMSKRKTHYLKMIDYFKTNYDCTLLDEFAAYQSETAKVYYCRQKTE